MITRRRTVLLGATAVTAAGGLPDAGDCARHQRVQAGDQLPQGFARSGRHPRAIGAIGRGNVGWASQGDSLSTRHPRPRFGGIRCRLRWRRRHVFHRRKVFSE